VSLLVVRLKRPGKTVELRVLANGGAEGPKPCVVATTGGGRIKVYC
jgi:hypothetical protein